MIDQAQPFLNAISDLLSSLSPLRAAVHETPNLIALQVLLQQRDKEPAICLKYSPIVSPTLYFIALIATHRPDLIRSQLLANDFK